MTSGREDAQPLGHDSWSWCLPICDCELNRHRPERCERQLRQFGSATRCYSSALGVGAQRGKPAKTYPRFAVPLVAGGLVAFLVSSWLTYQPYSAGVRVLLGRLMISLASVSILYPCMYSNHLF
jgi:hypothetical protein